MLYEVITPDHPGRGGQGRGQVADPAVPGHGQEGGPLRRGGAGLHGQDGHQHAARHDDGSYNFV